MLDVCYLHLCFSNDTFPCSCRIPLVEISTCFRALLRQYIQILHYNKRKLVKCVLQKTCVAKMEVLNELTCKPHRFKVTKMQPSAIWCIVK